jgi:hypothetical protein
MTVVIGGERIHRMLAEVERMAGSNQVANKC